MLLIAEAVVAAGAWGVGSITLALIVGASIKLRDTREKNNVR